MRKILGGYKSEAVKPVSAANHNNNTRFDTKGMSGQIGEFFWGMFSARFVTPFLNKVLVRVLPKFLLPVASPAIAFALPYVVSYVKRKAVKKRV